METKTPPFPPSNLAIFCAQDREFSVSLSLLKEKEPECVLVKIKEAGSQLLVNPVVFQWIVDYIHFDFVPEHLDPDLFALLKVVASKWEMNRLVSKLNEQPSRKRKRLVLKNTSHQERGDEQLEDEDDEVDMVLTEASFGGGEPTPTTAEDENSSVVKKKRRSRGGKKGKDRKESSSETDSLFSPPPLPSSSSSSEAAPPPPPSVERKPVVITQPQLNEKVKEAQQSGKGIHLPWGSFTSLSFPSGELKGSQLSNCVFKGVNLAKPNLSESDFSDSNLSSASLNQASLSKCLYFFFFFYNFLMLKSKITPYYFLKIKKKR